MFEVDLSRLLGRKSFTILYTLSRNRCKVNTTTLADLGANAFAFFDTKCAKKLFEFLNTPLKILERPILVKGYNRQAGQLII